MTLQGLEVVKFLLVFTARAGVVLLSQDSQQGSLLKALFDLIQFMAPEEWRHWSRWSFIVGTRYSTTLLEVILGGCQEAECRGDLE